jgi:hypothetical protein
MINISLANLRNSEKLYIDDIAIIINNKKKEEIGYFIPKSYKREIEKFIKDIEYKKKIELLQKVKKASQKDCIGDGTVGDGI